MMTLFTLLALVLIVLVSGYGIAHYQANERRMQRAYQELMLHRQVQAQDFHRVAQAAPARKPSGMIDVKGRKYPHNVVTFRQRIDLYVPGQVTSKKSVTHEKVRPAS